jgi:COMPASS component SWD2
MKKFTSFSNENSLTIEVSFTPDSNYIVSGSENGLVHIWDIKTGDEIIRLEGHIKAVRCVKFSPTHLLMASGCKNVIFWIPREYPKN